MIWFAKEIIIINVTITYNENKISITMDRREIPYEGKKKIRCPFNLKGNIIIESIKAEGTK